MKFEQRFVDAAQFFRPEVPPIHVASEIMLDPECQRPDGFEKVAIRKLAGIEVWRSGVAPEERAKCRKSKLRDTLF